MKNYKIYKHTNKINQKVYIGQTCTSLKARFGKDGIGYRGCKIFYSAIQKYGWENFEHEILEENIASDELANEREKYYIALYQSTNPKYGYNIQNGGHSQNLLSIKVYQYNIDGDYIGYFESIAEAMRTYNIANGKISDCCNGRKKSAGGYRWSYIKLEHLEPYTRNTNSKQVFQYSLAGKFIKSYESVVAAGKTFNAIKGTHITSCCKGRRETAYGFMWRYQYYEQIPPAQNIHNQGVQVIQYDRNKNNIISIFPNLIEASKQFGDKQSKAYFAINRCLNKTSKSAYGYYWEYCTR